MSMQINPEIVASTAAVETSASALPNLLYVGDVSPCRGGASGQLYEMLQHYPANKLMVVESQSTGEPQLPGVTYVPLTDASGRLSLSEGKQSSATKLWQHRKASPHMVSLARQFAPQAILTSGDDQLWLTASDLAETLSLPLHLICLSDLSEDLSLPMRFWRNSAFSRVYKQAATRWCASASLAATNQKRFGASANVLFPVRSAGSPIFDSPSPRIGNPALTQLTFAYVGNADRQENLYMVSQLAKALVAMQGRLLLFGNVGEWQKLDWGLNKGNIELRPALCPAELAATLRESADCLFIARSFSNSHRKEIELTLPMELADCSGAGVPLLICGPTYCAAVRWAKENPGVAQVAQSENYDDLRLATLPLASGTQYRLDLASRLLEVGDRCFTARSAIDLLSRQLHRTTLAA